jgi:hypothetical protein
MEYLKDNPNLLPGSMHTKKMHSFLALEVTNISTKSTVIHRYQSVKDVEDIYTAKLFIKQ